jgi:hypothetical protein
MEVVGRDDIPLEILDVSKWQIKRIVAEHYSTGNVFYLGDTAHRYDKEPFTCLYAFPRKLTPTQTSTFQWPRVQHVRLRCAQPCLENQIRRAQPCIGHAA